MDKVKLPDWAEDDSLAPLDGADTKDLETMIIITIKKLNEIIEWINEQNN